MTPALARSAAADRHHLIVPAGPAVYGVIIGLTALVQTLMWVHVTRPGGPGDGGLSPGAVWKTTLSMGSAALVFLGSVLIAQVSAAAAIYSWIMSAVLNVLIGRFVSLD
jgi:phosphatidylglycerophosphate synthase